MTYVVYPLSAARHCEPRVLCGCEAISHKFINSLLSGNKRIFPACFYRITLFKEIPQEDFVLRCKSILLEMATKTNSPYNYFMPRSFYLYILTNRYNTVLYVGVTNNLDRRILQHRTTLTESFSSIYRLTKLVYYEEIPDANAAIEREKQLKGGSRQDKIDLIQGFNPNWDDLFPQQSD
jgi:putative endonuclease